MGRRFRDVDFAVAIIAGILAAALWSGMLAFGKLVLELGWTGAVVMALVGVALALSIAFVAQHFVRKQLEGELEKWKGLQATTGLCEFEKELDHSDEHPRAQLDVIRSSLEFMGNGGSKWTEQEGQMRRMLDTVGNAGGTVKMLLLHPGSTVCTERSKAVHGSEKVQPLKNIRSLRRLTELRKTYSNLEVLVYDHLPYFRLTFVDGNVAIVGHYKHYRADSAASPLVLWEPTADGWGFYAAFQRYFEGEWDAGKPITETELDDLDERFGNGA